MPIKTLGPPDVAGSIEGNQVRRRIHPIERRIFQDVSCREWLPVQWSRETTNARDGAIIFGEPERTCCRVWTDNAIRITITRGRGRLRKLLGLWIKFADLARAKLGK